jgi:hypothetical protein
MRYLVAAAVSALGVLALAPGCFVATSKSCTLLGCDSTISVRYAKPIAGSYALTVQTGGLTMSGVTCPAPSTVPPGSGGVLVQCDGNGFTLSSANAFGSNPEGAQTIPLTTTVTPHGGGPASSASASPAIVSTSQPNGPSCGPTCYAYSAQMQ